MNKKTLGILIPYYKNSEEIEIKFKELMENINNQINDKMILVIVEDGQDSEWINEYINSNVKKFAIKKNKGVSHARNIGIDYLIDKVKYILFIDSDDTIEENFLKKMYEYCDDNSHEVVESIFYVNNQKSDYNEKVVRSGTSGSAIKTEIIKDNRFDEKLQIGEDTKFMNTVIDLTKHRKRLCPTKYKYNYGLNPNSLIVRYNRKEIGKERYE